MTNMALRVIRWASAGFLWMAAAAPVAAQDPGVDPLAAQAEAIAVVEVAFVPYGNLVLLKELLRGTRERIPELSALMGPCLPGKAELRDRAEGATEAENTTLLQNAINNAGYEAVIFVGRRKESMTAICDDPQMLDNWTMHPRHGAWRARLDAWLRHR
ncbi:MAG: hypothetical protein ACKVP2_08700 [Burkholderiales bacterium]